MDEGGGIWLLSGDQLERRHVPWERQVRSGQRVAQNDAWEGSGWGFKVLSERVTQQPSWVQWGWQAAEAEVVAWKPKIKLIVFMKGDACGPELKRRTSSLYFKERKAELRLSQSWSHPLTDYGTLKIPATFASVGEGDSDVKEPLARPTSQTLSGHITQPRGKIQTTPK